MNKILIISGASGAGKDTMIHHLLKKVDQIKMIQSATTRKRRISEAEDAYDFITEEEFLKRRKEHYFVEDNLFGGHWYGTPFIQIEKAFEEGKTALLKIDVNGRKQVLKKPLHTMIHSVFIMPPSPQILMERLCTRHTETKEEILVRLKTAVNEIKEGMDYDAVIVNEDLEQAVSILIHYIETGENKSLLIDMKAFIKQLEEEIQKQL